MGITDFAHLTTENKLKFEKLFGTEEFLRDSPHLGSCGQLSFIWLMHKLKLSRRGLT